MSAVTFDGLTALLPELDELRPLLNHAMGISTPDPNRRWSGSGELGTSGRRLVDTTALRDAVATIVEVEEGHTRRLYALVAEALAQVGSGDVSGAAEALLQAAALEEGRDRPGRSAAYADAAVRVGRGRAVDELVARALRRRARANRGAGRLLEAERDYNRAYEIGEALGDIPGAAEAAIGAGNVFEEQGRWDEAEDWYRRALATLEAADTARPERWHALLNLHVVLRSKGDLEGAAEPLELAAAYAAELEDPSAGPGIENARGQWEMAQGRYQEATQHFRNGLSYAAGARAQVTIRLNLGEALFAAGRRLDAAEEVRRAERGAIVARLPQKLPEVYRLLGRIAAAEGNAEAFVFFEHALEITSTHDLPDLERALTLQAYAEVEAAGGEGDSSADLLRQADAIYRRLGINHRRSEWADRFGSGSSHEDEIEE